MNPSSNGKAGSVADAVVAQLAAAGVKRVYGVIGDAVFPLAHALQKQSTIQFVAAVHEANAAYMASYEAKLTGRPTACMATSGPGATNLATGLADAYFDGAPVIAVTGQVPTAKFGLGAKQWFDQQAFFGPITGSSALVLSGPGALHGVLAALDHALVHATATHVAIPRDVLEQPVPWAPIALPVVNGPLPEAPPGSLRILGDEEAAVNRLRNARRPVVVLGLIQPDIAEATVALADRLGAALVVAQQAKGAVAYDYPQLIGGIGEAHVPPLLKDTDLLVLVGPAPYELRFIPPSTPAVVVGPTHRPLSQHPLLAAWIGPVPKALHALQRQLGDRRPDAAWQDAIKATREDLAQQAATVYETEGNGDGCNPYRIALALSDTVADDAILAVDVGAFSHWFDLGFRVGKQTVLASPYWRGIGFALPAAIGARFAHPDRQVVAVVGDGALLQAMGELTTAVRYKLPIVLVVINNAVYDIERQKMTAAGLGALGTALPGPDFVAFAQACGGAGLRVRGPDELTEALAHAFNEAKDGPVLIDVRSTVPALPHLASVGQGG